ncbi:LysE family translocator [Asticcacaulis sp. ZE23SCel15]|uniref:LysE family translocator n=1 Tax=Asticcacaulis sp. ZE23SCel15 TaxID=3059027 RepID=UPI00265DEE15|nr:LysE family translocator [Asticcacaulis sp. ZE23SCel15]WKL56366.1 LysE family translocator [Asticcacaulis sp. ZE23SCel15]
MSNLLAFAFTALLIELTPGPNMGYIAITALSRGRAAGFALIFGIALGLLLAGFVAATGLAVFIQSNDIVYQILRWAGVLYLLWLAFDGWRSANETSPHFTDTKSTGATYLRRGLITNLLNPKAAVFYIATLPQFIDPGRPTLPQSLTLTLIYVAIATAIHAVIVITGTQAGSFLANEARMVKIRRVLSGLLAVTAFWLAFSTAR